MAAPLEPRRRRSRAQVELLDVPPPRGTFFVLGLLGTVLNGMAGGAVWGLVLVSTRSADQVDTVVEGPAGIGALSIVAYRLIDAVLAYILRVFTWTIPQDRAGRPRELPQGTFVVLSVIGLGLIAIAGLAVYGVVATTVMSLDATGSGSGGTNAPAGLGGLSIVAYRLIEAVLTFGDRVFRWSRGGEHPPGLDGTLG